MAVKRILLLFLTLGVVAILLACSPGKTDTLEDLVDHSLDPFAKVRTLDTYGTEINAEPNSNITVSALSPLHPINKINLVEIRVQKDGQGNNMGGSIISESPILKEGSTIILRDDFAIDFYFPQRVDKEEIESRLKIEPALPYQLQEGIMWGREWRMGVLFDKMPETGETFKLHLEGFHWSEAGEGESIELVFVRAEEPKLTMEYLSNSNRVINSLFSFDEFGFYQLPYSENQFQIHFTKPMNQSSVEKLVRDRLGKSVTTKFHWQSKMSLLLTISGEPSDQQYVLSFTGALDLDGLKVLAQPEIRFIFVQPKAFYTYDLSSKTTTLFYEANMAINDAKLLRGKQYIHISDQIGFFHSPYYEDYLLNIESFAWVHCSSSDYDEIILQSEIYRDNFRYDIFFADTLPDIESKSTELKRLDNGIIFSPSGEKAAIFVADERISNMDDGTKYAVNVAVYNVEKKERFNTYNALFYNVFEFDGTDAFIPEELQSFLHYKPKYAYWLSENHILIEYLSEDKEEMRIGLLDLKSGDFQQLVSQRINPIASPNGNYFVARTWNTNDAAVLDLTGTVISTFTMAMDDQVIWSEQGDRFVYKDVDGMSKIYDMQNNSIIVLETDFGVAGWLDDHRLLIYK